MESSDEDEHAVLIDKLLDALNGLEKCFENENEDAKANIAPVICLSEDIPSVKIEEVTIMPKGKGAAKRAVPESKNAITRKKVCCRKSPVKRNESQPKHIEDLLPVEILITIFKYLPVCDRKAAKLVCKRWNSVHNMKLFAQTQRYICSGIYKTQDIITCLMNTKCDHLNLEFYRVNFADDYPIEFWQRIGPKIHALYFVDCVLTTPTVKEMINHCKELEHLSFYYEYCRSTGQFLWRNELLPSFIEAKNIRPKLASLELHMNQSKWLSNSILMNLFIVFPKISKFEMNCHSIDPISCGTEMRESVAPHEVEFSDLWSSKALTFSSILNKILTSSDSLETLKLDLHTSQRRTGFAWNSIVTHANLQRLREVYMEIDLRCVEGAKVIDFCAMQKQLKSLSCRIVGSAKLFTSLFVSQLLDNCPALRDLNVAYNSAVFISYELFRKLINSNLRSFMFQCNGVILAPRVSYQKDWPTNLSLRTLHTSCGVGEEFQLLMIRTFRKLRHLELYELTDTLLQAVWKNQPDLISLKLCDVENCTELGFSGSSTTTAETYSIRRLQKLEYLVIEAVNTEWNVSDEVFSEFVLPNLRYLCVDIEGQEALRTAMLEKIKTLSKLVAASIRCSGIPRHTWLNFVLTMKNLRYLKIVDDESQQFTRKQYLSYFKTCPQLRAFVHEFGRSSATYYYDVFEKTVQMKKSKTKYRISSEKVNKSLIDWVWF